jgi:tetratricopeptide (TPR) repeat protein
MLEDRNKGLVRGLVDFALNQDVAEEIKAQYRVLEGDPMCAAAHLNLGILFYSQGRIEDSLREFLMSIECDSSQGTAYRKLGEVYVGLADYAQAALYARMAADRGDTGLLEAFTRYPKVLDDQGKQAAQTACRGTDEQNIDKRNVMLES